MLRSNTHPTATMPTNQYLRSISRVFRALGDEHRLAILALLKEHGELSVSALGEMLEQSQPAVSHHLNQLRGARLIDFRRNGKFNYYYIDQEGLTGLFEQLGPVQDMFSLALGGLELHLKKK